MIPQAPTSLLSLLSVNQSANNTHCKNPPLLLSSMEFQRRQGHCLSERKGQKRKLDEESQDEPQISAASPTADERATVLSEVEYQVNILESTFTWKDTDRAAAKRATHALTDLAKNEGVVNVIVEGGAIPALVKHLQAPPVEDCNQKALPFEHEVEKGSALALGLLAVKPEHQQLIIDSGALTYLVDLLKRHNNGLTSPYLLRTTPYVLIQPPRNTQIHSQLPMSRPKQPPSPEFAEKETRKSYLRERVLLVNLCCYV